MILDKPTQQAFVDELLKIAQAEFDVLRQVERQRSEDTAKALRTVASVTKPAKNLALVAGEVVPAVRAPIRRGAGVLGIAAERAAAKAERAAEFLSQPDPKYAAASNPLAAPAPKLTDSSLSLQQKSMKKDRATALPRPSNTSFNQQSSLLPGAPTPPG